MSDMDRTAIDARPARPRKPRWTDAITVVVLGSCAASVLIASTPTLLRTAGLGHTRRAPIVEAPHRDGILEGARSGPPVLYYDDSDEEADDEGEPIDDLQRLYPEPGNWPGKRGDRDPSAAPVPSTIDSAFGRMPIAAALRPIELLKSPAGGADVTGDLEKGDLVRVIKEQGDWALVLNTKSAAMGWARLSELAVR